NDPGQIRDLLAPLRGDESLAGVPALLKISPDLADRDHEQLTMIALEGGAAGMVATNTSAELAGARGGLSGRPLRSRANEVLRRIHRQAGAALTLVGVGGVFTAR